MQGFWSILFMVIEIGVIQTFSWLQLIFGSLAIILLISGFGLLLVDKKPRLGKIDKQQQDITEMKVVN
jgi:hypothetical protein